MTFSARTSSTAMLVIRFAMTVLNMVIFLSLASRRNSNRRRTLTVERVRRADILDSDARHSICHDGSEYGHFPIPRFASQLQSPPNPRCGKWRHQDGDDHHDIANSDVPESV